MSYMINDECTSCGICETECPNDAISEGEDVFVIDSDRCTECVGFYDTQQCAEVCPVDACVPNPDMVESEENLMAKKVSLHGE